VIRQAGKQDGEAIDVEKVTSFAELPVYDPIKISVSKKGWQAMSKIQQIGIPLFLSNPPRHMIAQAQAGIFVCLVVWDGMSNRMGYSMPRNLFGQVTRLFWVPCEVLYNVIYIHDLNMLSSVCHLIAVCLLHMMPAGIPSK
jgi:hypothetical protein